MCIKYTRVSERLACVFAFKFETGVVGTSISQRVTKQEGKLNIQRKPSINIKYREISIADICLYTLHQTKLKENPILVEETGRL